MKKISKKQEVMNKHMDELELASALTLLIGSRGFTVEVEGIMMGWMLKNDTSIPGIWMYDNKVKIVLNDDLTNENHETIYKVIGYCVFNEIEYSMENN